MKKRRGFVFVALMLAMTMLLSVSVLVGCGDATVKELKLDTAGATLTFEQGDTFSPDGLKVVAVMSDGMEREVALSECEFSSVNMNALGRKDVVVSYNGARASYTVTINKKTLEWKETHAVDPSIQTKFELSAMSAVLDGSDRLGPSDIDPDVSVGGMVPDDRVVFMITSAAAGKAKLFIDFDHSAHGDTPVGDLIVFSHNEKEIATDAVFNAGEPGHAHAAWKCYQRTYIAEIDIVAGRNTILMQFLGNGSNLKGLYLEFDDDVVVDPGAPTVVGITASTEKKTFF